MTISERFWSKVDKAGPCWLWTDKPDPDGYGQLRVTGRNIRAHRLSYTLAYGPIPDGLDVCHHCDVPLCVRPDHLFIGTHADNVRDMDQKGRRNPARGDKSGSRKHPERQVRGTRHGMARLTEADVVAIRESIARGIRQSDLAAQYGVSRALVTLIKQRRLWAHL